MYSRFISTINSVECKETKEINEDPARRPLVDIFLNPGEEENKNLLIKTHQNVSREYFRNFAKVYPQLFELLWYTSLPCYEMAKLTKDPMIRSCHIAGEKMDCARIFSKVPTDQGMCCAINSEIALKKSVYSKKVEDLQNSSEYMASGQNNLTEGKLMEKWEFVTD